MCINSTLSRLSICFSSGWTKIIALATIVLVSCFSHASGLKIRTSIDPFTDEPNAVVLIESHEKNSTLMVYCAHKQVHTVLFERENVFFKNQVFLDLHIDKRVTNRLVGFRNKDGSNEFLLDDDGLLAEDMIDGDSLYMVIYNQHNAHVKHKYNLIGAAPSLNEVLRICQI